MPEYTLSDVAKMSGRDYSLDEVRNMPTRQAIRKQIETDAISRGAANFAEGMSPSDRFYAGAGKAVADMGRGIMQLVGRGDQADIDEAKRLDTPLMNTGAGIAGNIAGNVASVVLPAGGLMKGAQMAGMARMANIARQFVNPTSWTGAVGAGAALNAAQPVATGENRLTNAVIGGATGGLGQGIVSGMSRVAQPVQNALEPVAQKAVDTLRNAGVPLNLAQVTGSPVWSRISSALGDNLFTMGAQAKARAAQEDAFTRAASNLIGENSTSLTSDVMGSARDRTNKVFGRVLSSNDVPLTPGLATDLADIQARALENEKQPVVNIVNRTFDAANGGTIPGQTAYNIVKDMRGMAQGAGQDSTLRHLAGDAQGALLDGINSSLSGADLAAFTEARRQQAIMHTLEGALPTDGTGTLSAPKLANIMGQKANRSMSVYGQGPQDLVELAQAGKQILGDKTGNSGTTARALAMGTAPALIGGTADAVYDYMHNDDLLGAVKHGASVVGGLYALPKAAQVLLNNPTAVKYLSEGIQPSASNGLLGNAWSAASPAIRGLLEAPAEGVMAGQTARALPALAARAAIPAAVPMSYEQYLKAYDAAPDAATRLELGKRFAAQLPTAQQ